ncbi:hypothetical protein GDO81_021395 [Engystomops pustulosus]|uniref:Uncharacterized protein n=1 Tax=Engystomops pustulosus TaxID=76066 RepID=A0AAV6ZA99_ENGPU|nr:hypothetical protein GDO81_021395 [Engystomops pustulosus]
MIGEKWQEAAIPGATEQAMACLCRGGGGTRSCLVPAPQLQQAEVQGGQPGAGLWVQSLCALPERGLGGDFLPEPGAGL